VLWVALLVVAYRGVAAIVTDAPAFGGGAAAPASGPAQNYPVALAKAYALEFGQVYLTWNPAGEDKRAARLAAFLPVGSDPEFGWNGTGTQTLQSEQVAGIRVLSPHRAIVTLLAEVDGGRLIELGVPLYTSAGSIVVSGQPALLPPPPQALLPVPAASGDQPAGRALTRVLPAFFLAYASGDAAGLKPLVTRDAKISGLGGLVSFDRIIRVSVQKAGVPAGATRTITVTVRWIGLGAGAGSPPAGAQPPAEIEVTYALTVVKQGGSWYVRSIGAAATQPGPSS
jgi:hypothetical protein